MPTHLQVVKESKEDSEQHLSDTQQDGHLHLVRVSEQELVGGYLPDLGRTKTW